MSFFDWGVIYFGVIFFTAFCVDLHDEAFLDSVPKLLVVIFLTCLFFIYMGGSEKLMSSTCRINNSPEHCLVESYKRAGGNDEASISEMSIPESVPKTEKSFFDFVSIYVFYILCVATPLAIIGGPREDNTPLLFLFFFGFLFIWWFASLAPPCSDWSCIDDNSFNAHTHRMFFFHSR